MNSTTSTPASADDSTTRPHVRQSSLRLIRFTTPFRQALGLMFQRPRPDTLYRFDFRKPVRHSFHMWFVFWPLDLYFLDEHDRVLSRRTLQPFTTYRPPHDYTTVIETAAGLLDVQPGERFPAPSGSEREHAINI